ncbi:MAG: DUF4350 domain-containing protein [Cyanobacteriota bacterium]
MKIINPRVLGILFLSILIFSCQNQLTVSVEPSIKPITSSTPPSITNLIDNRIGTLYISVVDADQKKGLIKAKVKLTHQGKETIQETDSTGSTKFSFLESGNDYSISVENDGYQSITLNQENAKINIFTSEPINKTIELFKNPINISGRIISDSGEPLDGVNITLNKNSVISDNKGIFSLKTTDFSNKNILTISKNGFKTTNITTTLDKNIDLGDLKLIKIIEGGKVFIDTSKRPLGDFNLNTNNHFSNLSNLLKDNKFTVYFDNFIAENNLDDIDTLIIPSPSFEYTDSEIDKIINFVKSGKKLFITCEWGGFDAFSSPSINKILKHANLKINIDLVKEKSDSTVNSDYIIVKSFPTHFITKDITSLEFFSSASIEVINGGITGLDKNQTKLIVSSSNFSFRIQGYRQGPFGLAAVSNIGNGKVVVLGDTSIITGSFSDNLKSDIDSFDNKKFILNILNW